MCRGDFEGQRIPHTNRNTNTKTDTNTNTNTGLVKCVEEALKARKVPDHFEDTEDPQNPDLLGNFSINMYL